MKHLYFSILNSGEEEIFNNECEYAAKKRKKEHFGNDTAAHSKSVFMISLDFYVFNVYATTMNCTAVLCEAQGRRCALTHCAQCCPCVWGRLLTAQLCAW